MALLLLPSATRGQNIISSPVQINLQSEPYESEGGNTYYKYGIWASLGGSTAPQLFEFDTGGAGFYAAYDTNSSWWGSSITPSSTVVTNSYDSGNAYVATAVQTSISLYNSGASGPVLTTGTNIYVGQTTSIINNGQTLWPSATNPPAPPVDNYFYGDFGLSLKAGNAVSDSNSISNVLAQMQYTNGLIGGYIIHTGPAGSTNGYIQVGITADQMATFPIQIKMDGKNTTDTFPNSGSPTYSGEIIKATMTLNNAYSTELGLNLDTGNPTPGLHNTVDGVPSDYITDTGDGYGYLDYGTLLDLVAKELGDDDTTNIFSLITGPDYGSDYVYTQLKDKMYLNIGVPFFQQWDVLYDFQNGVLGLRPSAVPEARQMAFLAFGFFLLWFFTVCRSFFFPKKQPPQ